jgi:cell division septation protein DedD
MAPAAVAAPAPATPAKPAPVAKTATPVAAQGQVQVQLAALDSQEAATAEWQRLQRKFPDMLSTRSPAMSHIERDGKQFWRLRVGGFVDVAGANSFCNQMRTKGATCVTARF